MSEDGSEGITPADAEAAREEVVDAMAHTAEVYGAKRSYGRLFGILYFAEEPLSLDDLVTESGYAKSTVSTAMNTLERAHLVNRRSVDGEGKRAFFEVENDFWDVFQQFLDQQVRREIETLSRALEAAELVFAEADDERYRADLERVRELGDLADRSEALIDVVTSDRVESVDSLTERLDGE